MALVKCGECGREISSRRLVLNVGTSGQKKTSLLSWLIGGFFMIAIIIGIANSQKVQDAESARVALLTPEQLAAEAKQKADAQDIDASRRSCEDAVKQSLYDPDSAQFDGWWRYPAHAFTPGVMTVEVGVRAKNGFGALRHVAFLCKAKKQGASWTAASISQIGQ